MKASKAIYSECFKEFEMNQKQLHLLQNTLFKMMIDIRYVCDKYRINYQLGGGTLLGAIRHNGFIPWDDDVDINMFRDEYERFAECFRKEFPDKYLLVEPLSDKLYFNKMPKVFLKNSIYIEIPKAGIHAFDMVYIDIFIIENVPASSFRRMIRGFFYDFAYLASSVCVDYKYPSPVIMKKCKENKKLNAYYNLRRRLGAFFYIFFGLHFYLWIVEKIANYEKKTGWIAFPAGIGYNREVFPIEFFNTVQYAMFCGEKFKIPIGYDAYLKNLYYNNYMQIPPNNKREVHKALMLRI